MPYTTADLLSRCSFPPPGTVVTCAVSGGADSTALLVLAVASGCRATAIHVDHGLRPGSADEAAIVAATAERLGAGFHAERIAVDDGPNLEARLRDARYAVLPNDVMTGHTADDQAETVLLNMLRGSGLPGLAGMIDREDGRRRPILRLRRSETIELCRTLDLPVIIDPSNDDRRFRRNRVRRELLPLLDDIAQRDVAGLLARQSEILRDDADLLDQLASTIDPTDAAALRSAPPSLARRALRRWLSDALATHHPPDAATVERVLAVARLEATGCDIGAGCGVRRSRGRLVVTAPRYPAMPDLAGDATAG